MAERLTTGGRLLTGLGTAFVEYVAAGGDLPDVPRLFGGDG